MSDDVLFASAPYIAACALLVAAAYRSMALSDRAAAGLLRPDGGSPVFRSIALGASLALVALHLVLLSAPDAVLRWNRSERRLLLLESASLFIGALSLLVLGRMIWRHRRSGAGHRIATGEVVMSTLIGIEIVSGLTLALLYRWASSWSVVTLTPYAVSVVHFNPRVELVARMPFPVRLHVFAAFAILGAIPFAPAGSMALVATRRAAATAAAPLARISRLFGTAAVEWTRRRVLPLVSGNDEGS